MRKIFQRDVIAYHEKQTREELYIDYHWYSVGILNMYALLLLFYLSTVRLSAETSENGTLRFRNKDHFDYPALTSTVPGRSRGVTLEEWKYKMEQKTTTKPVLLENATLSDTLANKRTNKKVDDGAVFESLELEQNHPVNKLQDTEETKMKNGLQHFTRLRRRDEAKLPFNWNEEDKVNNGFTRQTATLSSKSRITSLQKPTSRSRLQKTNLLHFLIKRTDAHHKSMETHDKNGAETLIDIPDNRTTYTNQVASSHIKINQKERHIRPTCKVKVLHKSMTYFHSQLISREPDFIQFALSICNKNSTIRLLYTDDVFQGKRWFWTYNSTSGPYPFLSWDLDYGILSFHLLEARTVHVQYVCITLESQKCTFTFGDHNTSQAIAAALAPLINITEGDDYHKFPANYFCYLSSRQDYFGTLHYWAAIYLYYPINFIYYRCCTVSLNYDNNQFVTKCADKEKSISGFKTWTVTKRLPYVLGILFLLYFPVMFFNITAWLAKDERIHDDVVMFEMPEDLECLEYLDENWQFADGNSPLTLGELLSFKTFGLDVQSVLVSRLRRLLFVVSFPILLYLQVAMYSEGMGLWDRNKIRVKDLVKVGTPMGFVSILADAHDRKRVFVPLLGGPVGVVIIYYLLSFLFIALPRSVKQAVEDGLPSSNLLLKSPLFFGTRESIRMSKINVKPYHLIPGYTKARTLMKCRFYMLFSRAFWCELWYIQTERILAFTRPENPCCCTNIVMISFFLPLYVLLCAVEIVCCIVFYGIPFCSLVSIVLNGALKSLRYLRDQSVILFHIFKYRITAFIGVSFVFVLFMIYIYVISLAFIISFVFIFQVITYCFVAIIIYPSVSFGYLFFFIVLLYYFIKLVGNFGDGYTELLTTTVDISRRLSEDNCTVTVYNRELCVSNVKVDNIINVRVNGKLLAITPDVLRSLNTDTSVPKVKARHGTYGISKKFFDFMVKEHRPVHQQVLKLFFKAAIMITFVILTLTISANYVTGPTTEISEVMHVIFIVAVGAVPQLVQAILSRSDTVLAREIEEREIERLIVEFWKREEEMKYLCTQRNRELYQNY